LTNVSCLLVVVQHSKQLLLGERLKRIAGKEKVFDREEQQQPLQNLIVFVPWLAILNVISILREGGSSSREPLELCYMDWAVL